MAVIKIVPMPGAVGDKGDEGAVGPRGQQGETGLQGPAGADALWSYNGEWQVNSSYATGDVVTYQGQLYYTKSVTTAGTLPTDTAKFDLIASKGADGSGGTANTGDITFDGVKIIGAGTASGDGYGNATIDLVPDADLLTNQYHEDQYLIIDPTAPNHIHIRGGGTQDESTADLFLGAELNNVQVSDQSREVAVHTRGEDTTYTALNVNYVSGESFVLSMSTEIAEGDSVIVNDISYPIANLVLNSPTEGLQTLTVTGVTFTSNETYTFVRISTNSNSWHFRSDGTLIGPEMGLTVLGLLNSDNDDLALYANDADIILQAASGKVDIIAPEVNIVSNVVPSSLNINTYLGAVINSNRTSTYAAEDKVVATLGDINAVVPAETSFTVNGGTLGTQPTFDGAPLFSGSYVKTGPMVHFQVQVDMDNILTFGSGQYFIDLPFPSKYGYQIKQGCLHDISSGKQYAIGGHVYAGQSQLALTFTNSAGQDEAFDFNSPVTLNVADNFHIAGTYISE
jgi:hypothetical protein